jgi:hypothetical protein
MPESLLLAHPLIAQLLTFAQVPWGNTMMLWWLSAAALPLLIHLLSRTRFQRTDWAAMRFLEAAWKRHARRLAIEQWIVLALRTVLLLLIAFALADPHWRSNSSQLGKVRSPVHWVVVLDGTVSMDAKILGETRFDAARKRAREFVGESNDGDSFSLILLADPPVVLVEEPTFDRDTLLDAIQESQRRDTGGHLASTLEVLQRVVAEARRATREKIETRVCFITDFSQATWGALDTPECKRRVASLATETTMRIVEVPSIDEVNDVAIVSAQLRDERSLMDNGVSFDVTLRKISGSVTSRKIQASVNGVPTANKTVAMVGSEVRQRIDLDIREPGEYAIELRIDDDTVPVNNRLARHVTLRDRLRVLLLEGQQRTGERLSMVLDPLREQKPIVVTRTPIRELRNQRLSDFDVVFLVKVSSLDVLESRMLANYLREGGGVVWTVGPGLDVARLSDSWKGVVPGDTLAFGAVSPRGDLRLDPGDYAHPILAAFSGQPRSGLISTRVFRHLLVRPQNDSTAVLSLQDSDPIMVSGVVLNGTSETGRWVFVAVPLGRADSEQPWSELTISPAFVPLVHETVTWAMRRPHTQRTVMVGEPLRFPASPTRAAEVIDPSGQRHGLVADEGQGFLFDGTVYAGSYQFESAGNSLKAVANVEVSETRLERYDSSLLPDVLQAGDDWGEEFVLRETTQGLPLFRFILAASLMLLCTESWLTHRRRASES